MAFDLNSTANIIPDGVLINGQANFVRATKPLTRINGSALVADDRWHDTTTNTDWFWNGTYWASLEVFTAPSTLSGTSSQSATGGNAPPYCGLGLRQPILLVSVSYLVRILGTHDASNNWTIQANSFNGAGQTANVGSPINTFTTWSLANSSTWVQREVPLLNTYFGTDFYDIRFTYTRNGTPANFAWSFAALNYRLVSP